MKFKRESRNSTRFALLKVSLVAGALALAHPAHAQTQGQSTYYKSTGSGSGSVTGSGVYIDASQFATSSSICVRINDALHAIPSTAGGAVIDARSISTSLSCTTDPFNGTYTITDGSVVLLPPAAITTSVGWAIPPATRLVGAGANLTTITASSTFPSTSAILNMGTSSCVPCQGVGIEDLGVSGGSGYYATAGILNQFSQEHSYVRNAVITNIAGVGLTVNTQQSGNSGPYENLWIIAGTSNTSTATACVVFGGNNPNVSPGSNPNNGPAGLRGLHNVSCVGNAKSQVGIDINTSNTTVENIFVSGFVDGIVVGDQANTNNSGKTNLTPVQGVVFENINGSKASGTQTDLIQISNAGNCLSTNCAGVNVTDIEILGVTDTGYTNIIDDQVTNYQIAGTSHPAVGMYVLGQPLDYQQVGANEGSVLLPVQESRFTTVASQASWAAGSSNVSSGTCTTPGSFYSNTTGTTTSNTFFACVPVSASSDEWKPIM